MARPAAKATRIGSPHAGKADVRIRCGSESDRAPEPRAARLLRSTTISTGCCATSGRSLRRRRSHDQGDHGPGPFTMVQPGAGRVLTRTSGHWHSRSPTAVMPSSATSQRRCGRRKIDEPMHPGVAITREPIALEAIDRALEGVTADHSASHMLRLRPDHCGSPGRLPVLAKLAEGRAAAFLRGGPASDQRRNWQQC